MKFRFLSVAAAALMFAACNEPLNEAAEVETSNLGGGVEEETIVSDNGAIQVYSSYGLKGTIAKNYMTGYVDARKLVTALVTSTTLADFNVKYSNIK